MFGDFGARFTRFRAVVESAYTAVVLVTSPEQDVLTEAHDLPTSLERVGINVRAVVVNRVHPAWPDGPKIPTAAPPLVRRLQKTLSLPSRQPLPLDWLVENFLAYQTRAFGEQHRRAQFGQRLPTSLPAPVHIPALPAFVAELGGLVLLHASRFGEDS